MLPELASSPSPARILVVEDDVLIRALLADELRSAGFTVVEASHADEALFFFKGGGAVDLVFSDVWMPGSLNGIELARKIRKDHPSLPIILSSGNLGPPSTEELGRFIRKPYNIDSALAMVRETLGLGRKDAR